MIIKSKDKHGNQIEFNPKGRGARYTVNGLKKERRSLQSLAKDLVRSALMWWSVRSVFMKLLNS